MPDDHPAAANRLHLAPGIWIHQSALQITATRSGGAGGQHVNKTETCVELRVAVAAICGLSPAMHLRLVQLAGSRLTADGELILVCDETRSRRRNEDLAIERLGALVVSAHAVPRPRRATRPTRGSVQRRLAGKAATGERKRSRNWNDRDA